MGSRRSRTVNPLTSSTRHICTAHLAERIAPQPAHATRRFLTPRYSKMSKAYTIKDVADHKTAEAGMWIIIDNEVYDVTEFVNEHPGGPKILKRTAGKDATKPFWKYHGDQVLKKYGPKLKIGTVEGAKL